MEAGQFNYYFLQSEERSTSVFLFLKLKEMEGKQRRKLCVG